MVGSVTQIKVSIFDLNQTKLEYLGISTNMENSEFSGNSVQPRGKFLTNKIVLV